jgi:lipid II:glycine glycyltransferase (peptidoglycan interpeptide bridge formation enzyme)
VFICYNARYGNILNSLPFYGSNGGIILSQKMKECKDVKLALLHGFHQLAKEKKALVSTLITNPLENEADFYEAHFHHILRDERIGQITPLPRNWQSKEDLREKLMDLFHQKTRNSIRKAQKSHLTVSHSDSLDSLQKLSALHRQNIEAMGGLAKPWDVFETIHNTFAYDQDYRIYSAEMEGKMIAALLVFFYNRTAEYFTPAIHEDYRVFQPMSLLIFEAMQEATRRGCFFWNWGGTWLTQKGVYHFKSRWGTEDKPYFYYIREYDLPNALHTLSAEEIVRAYPYFYVFPFNRLEKGRAHIEQIRRGNDSNGL